MALEVATLYRVRGSRGGLEGALLVQLIVLVVTDSGRCNRSAEEKEYRANTRRSYETKQGPNFALFTRRALKMVRESTPAGPESTPLYTKRALKMVRESSAQLVGSCFSHVFCARARPST
eukprot:7079148-Pyramimonas_sp.AAC.1